MAIWLLRRCRRAAADGASQQEVDDGRSDFDLMRFGIVRPPS
jgi:hypothetical protein